MTATVSTFRTDFPEFTDPVVYPTGQISFWMGIATKLLDAGRWCEMLDHGVELFTAHHMAMQMQNNKASQNGTTPGQQTGMVSGKSIDKISVTYDTSATIMENAAHFNLTTYGMQFIYLARMIGAGGMQVNGCGGIGVFPIWSAQP